MSYRRGRTDGEDEGQHLPEWVRIFKYYVRKPYKDVIDILLGGELHECYDYTPDYQAEDD